MSRPEASELEELRVLRTMLVRALELPENATVGEIASAATAAIIFHKAEEAIAAAHVARLQGLAA